ncbi:MAG: glycosyltransferase [Desertimonas sp.]
MDTDAPLAPPVVAVMVVHAPGPWFGATLDALARQDYPNLNTLFLLTGPTDDGGGDVRTQILDRLPGAFVRDLGANRGFGIAANEVLQLVEGDSGFFCFLHDDVAPDPDAIRALVEELYRSNAGVVGPKLVEWDHPGTLQHVGLGLDRFGEIDPIIEPDEADQEQHDRVRDVFVVPSACLLVRADLFRTVGGFDPALSFHGEDVELCWRVHLSGARVVVAPQARARHREQLEARRPDLNHAAMRARHRMRAVATLTSGTRLLVRSVELVVFTVIELVVGLFTGRFGEAWASLRGLVGLIPRTPALLARRRAVHGLRHVPDQELVALHSKGNARIASYLRSRQTTTYVGEETSVRRWRESTLGANLVWVVLVAWLLVASRSLINDRVPPIGEMLPFPDSPGDLWSQFVSGWNSNGLGSTSAPPTGWGLLSILSILWAARAGLGLTVAVIGSILLGLLGMWRLAAIFPHHRARIVALMVYGAVPLIPSLVSTGRLGALFAYATVPWFVHLLRRALGIGTADPELVDEDLVDGILEPTPRERVRRTAVLALVAAVGVALAPPIFVVAASVVAVFAASSLAAGAGVRTSGWSLATGLIALGGAWVLNLPYSLTWSWSDLTAIESLNPPGRGLVEIASMDFGEARFALPALALIVPVVTTLVLARSWRLTWAGRAAGLVLVFGLLAVLQDRGIGPRLPDIGYLLVPMAVGLALGAASLAAAFGDDVAGRSFGWRQPVALAGLGAVAVGCLPAVFTVTDGGFFAPRSALTELTTAYAGTNLDETTSGVDARVVYLGDPRLLPVRGTTVADGVAMAVIDDGPLDTRDRWPADDGELRAHLVEVVRDIAAGQTGRGGRMLAPFGVRFVVVPLVDGLASTNADPLPAPEGLISALSGQLDLRQRTTLPSFVVFENTAAWSTVTHLGEPLAEATTADSLDVLIELDTTTATPILAGADRRREATGAVEAGTAHVGISPDDHWELTVDGTAAPLRPAFGATSAYDVSAGGTATLVYSPSGARRAALVLVALAWLATILAASRLGLPSVLRRTRGRDETLLDLDRAPGAVDLAELDRPDAERTGFGGWVDERSATALDGTDLDAADVDVDDIWELPADEGEEPAG